MNIDISDHIMQYVFPKYIAIHELFVMLRRLLCLLIKSIQKTDIH